MGERERERDGKRERDGGRMRERNGEGTEDNEGLRRRRKGSRFVVESKVFELVLVERRGKPQIFIEERKRGVSSWVRVGVESLGFLLEGLNHCIKDEKEGRWKRDWKEQGRSYSLLRSANKAGCFLRLGAIDSEQKQYSIYIPKGRGEKEGWATMAENLQLLRRSIGRKDNIQEEKVGGNFAVKRTFAEVVKRPICRDKSLVNVEVRWEEIHRNLKKLEHCIVGSWNPRSGEREDLEKLGKFLANSWGLKGSLWLARLERNRIFLKFELLDEAQRALFSRERTMGGLMLRFEHWSPRTGCREEEEQSNEVWVRIFGLPVSLWNPTVLSRVGDECGGFIAIDP